MADQTIFRGLVQLDVEDNTQGKTQAFLQRIEQLSAALQSIGGTSAGGLGEGIAASLNKTAEAADVALARLEELRTVASQGGAGSSLFSSADVSLINEYIGRIESLKSAQGSASEAGIAASDRQAAAMRTQIAQVDLAAAAYKRLYEAGIARGLSPAALQEAGVGQFGQAAVTSFNATSTTPAALQARASLLVPDASANPVLKAQLALATAMDAERALRASGEATDQQLNASQERLQRANLAVTAARSAESAAIERSTAVEAATAAKTAAIDLLLPQRQSLLAQVNQVDPLAVSSETQQQQFSADQRILRAKVERAATDEQMAAADAQVAGFQARVQSAVEREALAIERAAAAAEKQAAAQQAQAERLAATDLLLPQRQALLSQVNQVDPLAVSSETQQQQLSADQRILRAKVDRAATEEQMAAADAQVAGFQARVQSAVDREALAIERLAAATEKQAALAERLAATPTGTAIREQASGLIPDAGASSVTSAQLGLARALAAQADLADKGAATTAQVAASEKAVEDANLRYTAAKNRAAAETTASGGNGGFVGGVFGTYGGISGAGSSGGGLSNLAYQAGTAAKYFALYAGLSEGVRIMRETIKNTEEYTRGVADLAIALGISNQAADQAASGYAKIGAALGAGPLESIDSAATLLRTFRDPQGNPISAAGTIGAQVGSQINILEGKKAIQPDIRSLVALSQAYGGGPQGVQDIYDQATVIAQKYGFQGAGAILPGAAAIGDVGQQSGFTSSKLLELIAGVSQQTGVSSDAAAGDIKRFLGAQNTPQITALFQQQGIDLAKPFADRMEELAKKISPEQLSKVLGTGGLGDARTTAAVVAYLRSIPYGQKVDAQVAGGGSTGAAQSQAELRLQSLAGVLTKFRTELEQLEIQFGRGGLIEGFTFAAKGALDLVSALTGLATTFNSFPAIVRDIALAGGALYGIIKARAVIQGASETGSAIVNNLAGRSNTVATDAEAAASERAAAAATANAAAQDVQAAAQGRSAETAGLNAVAQDGAAAATALETSATGFRRVTGAIGGFIGSIPGLITILGIGKVLDDYNSGKDAGKTAGDGLTTSYSALNKAIASGDPKAIQDGIDGVTKAVDALNKLPDTNFVTKLAFATNPDLLGHTQSDGPGFTQRPTTNQENRDRASQGLPPTFYTTALPDGGSPGARGGDLRSPDPSSILGLTATANALEARGRAELAAQAAVAAKLASGAQTKTQDIFGPDYSNVGRGLATIKTSRVSPDQAVKYLNDELDHIKGNISALEALDVASSGSPTFDALLGKLRTAASANTNPLAAQDQLAKIRDLSHKKLAEDIAGGLNSDAIDAATQAVQADDKAFFGLLVTNTQAKINSIHALQGNNAHSQAQIRALATAALRQTLAGGDIGATVSLLAGVDAAFITNLTHSLQAEQVIAQNVAATLAAAASLAAQAGSLTHGLNDLNFTPDSGKAAAASTAQQAKVKTLTDSLANLKIATSISAPSGGDFTFPKPPKDKKASGPTAQDIELARIQAQAIAGEPVQDAVVAVQAAQYQLNTAKDKQAYWVAIKGLNDAKYALAQAELANSDNLAQLGIDLTNPLAVAKEKVREAVAKLSYDKGRGASSAANADALALKQAQNDAAKTSFDQQFGDEQTNFQLQRISLGAYLSYLHSQHDYLTAVKGKTRQQIDELNQVDGALQSLTAGLNGQFNLGNIKVPTPYEVRRSLAVGASQATTLQTVNITVNGNDLNAMKGVLGQYFGTGITQTVASQPAKVG